MTVIPLDSASFCASCLLGQVRAKWPLEVQTPSAPLAELCLVLLGLSCVVMQAGGVLSLGQVKEIIPALNSSSEVYGRREYLRGAQKSQRLAHVPLLGQHRYPRAAPARTLPSSPILKLTDSDLGGS